MAFNTASCLLICSTLLLVYCPMCDIHHLFQFFSMLLTSIHHRNLAWVRLALQAQPLLLTRLNLETFNSGVANLFGRSYKL